MNIINKYNMNNNKIIKIITKIHGTKYKHIEI